MSAPRYILTLGELESLIGKTRLAKEVLTHLGGGRWGVPPEIVREQLLKKGYRYSPKVVVHVNLKGGIGKTTAAISAASRAAQYGHRTCILDMDPQGSATLAFEIVPAENDPIFYDIWQKPAIHAVAALKQIDPMLHLLPSTLENALLDFSLSNPRNQKTAVAGVCQTILESGFDLIFIDCPPSLGTAVISSICAADTVVIPIGSDPFSRKGLQLTLDEIAAICDTFQMELPRIHTLFSRYDRREKMAQTTLSQLAGLYKNYRMPVDIRVTTAFSKALARGETVFASHQKSTAREDYDAYIRHLLALPGKKSKRRNP